MMTTTVMHTIGCLPSQQFAQTKDTMMIDLVQTSENLASQQETDKKSPFSLLCREAVDIADIIVDITNNTVDGSVEPSGESKRSEVIWVHRCEENGAFSSDVDTDVGDTEGLVQKFSSISFGDKTLSITNKEEEMNYNLSDPASLILISEGADPILPVSGEEARASDDNDSQDDGSSDDPYTESSTPAIARQKGSPDEACSTPNHPSECDTAKTPSPATPSADPITNEYDCTALHSERHVRRLIPRRTSAESPASLMSETSFTVNKQPPRSILKTSADVEILCKTNHRAWKKLPPPDMERIKLKRSETLAMLESQQIEENGVCPPTTRPISHQRARSEGANSQIQFDKVFIREFQQTIGDNPSVSYGTPISLDWDYMDNDPLDLDIYDAQKTKRTLRQMFLNHYQRKHLLINKYGHSPAEVKAAKHATNKVKSKRSTSRMMQTTLRPLLYVEEMRESVVRKAKRRLSKDLKAEEASFLALSLIEEEE